MTAKSTMHYEFEFQDIGENGRKLFPEIVDRLHEIDYVVLSGTALGLYRDNELIPTDTDIDLVVIGDSQADTIRDLFSDYLLVFETWENDKVQQLAYQEKGVLIDIHFYYKEGENYVCHHKGGVFTIEREQLDEPTLRATKYGAIPFPKDPVKFFEKKYGKDWKTPQYRKKGQYA